MLVCYGQVNFHHSKNGSFKFGGVLESVVHGCCVYGFAAYAPGCFATLANFSICPNSVTVTGSVCLVCDSNPVSGGLAAWCD